MTLFPLLVAAISFIPPSRSPELQLGPCDLAGLSKPAQCGTYVVPERRDLENGRKLSLRVVVVPTVKRQHEDPIVFIPGGPGQGAAQLAVTLLQQLQGIDEGRDVVFIDQRGTGQSSPLSCDGGFALLSPARRQELRACAAAAPVREADGRIIAAVGLFQNVAELRETTRERIESEQFRELFVNAIGHDLRNPLTVITTGAASLARHRHTDADARIAARLTSSAERMERMIAQLLDLVQSRLPGGLTLSLEKTDLREIMRSVIYRPRRRVSASLDRVVGRRSPGRALRP